MCIICNLPPFDFAIADRFLNEFDRARDAMRSAEKAMLACAASARQGDVDKVYTEDGFGLKTAQRYDRIHKKMVRVRRLWAQIEAEREKDMPLPKKAQTTP